MRLNWDQAGLDQNRLDQTGTGTGIGTEIGTSTGTGTGTVDQSQIRFDQNRVKQIELDQIRVDEMS